MRAAELIAIVLMALFGALDLVLFAHPGVILALRYGMVCPIMLLACGATYWTRLAPWVERITAFAIVVVIWTMAVMLLVAYPQYEWVYHASAILALSYAYASVRLRFGISLATGVVSSLGYGTVVAAIAPLATSLAVIGLLLAANMVGATTSHHLERTMRDEFRARRFAEELAMRDPLTGLGNRRALEQKVTELIALHRRYGAGFSVVLLDLDDFKAVNDTLGHVVGDALLRAVGERIHTTIRDTDAGYRYGGDEFVVLAPATDAEGAARVADRLLAALPETIPGTGRSVSFSAGVYEVDGGAAHFEAVIDAASVPLKSAKRSGKARVVAALPRASTA